MLLYEYKITNNIKCPYLGGIHDTPVGSVQPQLGLLRPRLLCSIQLGSAQSKLAVKGESPSWIQTLRIPQLQLHKGSSSERLDRHVGNAVPIPLPALRRTLTPPPVHPGRTQTLRVTSQVLRRKSQSLGFHPLLEGNPRWQQWQFPLLLQPHGPQ